MELWIRSQNRTMLCKPQYIELYGESEVHYGDISIGYRCVATYSTRERALEVLDEIQNILRPQIIFKSGKIIGGFNDTIISSEHEVETQELSTYVYEMPKE